MMIDQTAVDRDHRTAYYMASGGPSYTEVTLQLEQKSLENSLHHDVNILK